MTSISLGIFSNYQSLKERILFNKHKLQFISFVISRTKNILHYYIHKNNILSLPDLIEELM